MKTLPLGIAFGIIAFFSKLEAQDILSFDSPECSGMSGFRSHWDMAIPVTENGARIVKDSVVKDRGQTAVWDGVNPGPLAFDAVHRNLLVRFPGAAEKIAEALASGKSIEKVELVLPYLDEEIWPTGSGGADYPSADGYRYRPNWDCDKLYQGQRPNWHAIAYLLRKPWQANAANGPTYNAAIKGAVNWKRFGAADTNEDRFAGQLGPVEVSSYKPDGRMDVTAVVTDEAYGKTLGSRLRALADYGFIVSKEEIYDARYYQGTYEWAISTGPRAILIKQPKLVVTFKPGKGEKIALSPAVDIPDLVAKHKDKPEGVPTAVVPTREELASMDQKFQTRPSWMPEWQYEHIKQLMSLETEGKVLPFYYRLVPAHVVNRAREVAEREAKARGTTADADYAVYLAWLDWVNGQPPRFWEGHLTGADNITQWYNFRDAMPAPVQESVIRCWNAWLMPDRETQLDGKLRRQYDDTSGKLVHPMVDDPRVGKDKDGKEAVFGQGDTYYRNTGDWRGNKSYYRSGFTREMSTANFNSSATCGALLNGQIIGSQRAIEDGRAGLMRFPFWQWTWGSGVGQEFIDHYYWAIASAGNKLFADFCQQPEDKMAGWSIIQKTANDLAIAFHPNLKKLMGPASRTYYEHVLGEQDGLYHILHTLSKKGALSDVATGKLPALTNPVPDPNGRLPKPMSAWGHDYPPQAVALNSMSGPWGDEWISEWIDEKPLPWSALLEKNDWVTIYFGENYGLSSIRKLPQRIHVLGHWRRKAEIPSGMRDIGTLDMRIGFNQTQIGDDGSGIISSQGTYRTYQHDNKLIMLAQPNPKIIAEQAAEHKLGEKKLPAQEIKSVQCTAALFNFEEPAPTWQIFVDDTKVESLPVTAKYGQVITIRDGVSYIAIRPLPTDDLGRDADITLEAGQPQTQAYHEFSNIQPALIIHSNFYRKGEAITKAALDGLKDASSGFIVEMGDEKEYGSFEKFQNHIRDAKLSGQKGEINYQSGQDTMVATWNNFTVNGKDPADYAKEQKLIQDTTLSQMGRRNLEKSGAVVERGDLNPELAMLLQTFPKQKIYVAANMLPNYISYSFREPGGVKIVADGVLSMGRWVVKDSREIDIKYTPFGDPQRSEAEKKHALASLLFVSGTKEKPKVTLNEKEITGELKAWKQEGVEGWLVPLGQGFPKNDEITNRLNEAAALVASKTKS